MVIVGIEDHEFEVRDSPDICAEGAIMSSGGPMINHIAASSVHYVLIR